MLYDMKLWCCCLKARQAVDMYGVLRWWLYAGHLP